VVPFERYQEVTAAAVAHDPAAAAAAAAARGPVAPAAVHGGALGPELAPVLEPGLELVLWLELGLGPTEKHCATVAPWVVLSASATQAKTAPILSSLNPPSAEQTRLNLRSRKNVCRPACLLLEL